MPPNSKHIIIHKPIYKSFLQIGFDELTDAYQRLSKSGLGLYLYLAKNKDGYDLDLSGADYCSKYKVCETTYKNAKKELIANRYLVEHINKDGSISKGWYDFFTMPKEANNCPKEQTKNCLQKDNKTTKENIIDKAEEIGIGDSLSALRASSLSPIQQIEEEAEEIRTITQSQLDLVINKEKVQENIWLINGKLYRLEMKGV